MAIDQLHRGFEPPIAMKRVHDAAHFEQCEPRLNGHPSRALGRPQPFEEPGMTVQQIRDRRNGVQSFSHLSAETEQGAGTFSHAPQRKRYRTKRAKPRL